MRCRLQYGRDPPASRDSQQGTGTLLEHLFTVAASQGVEKAVAAFGGHDDEIGFRRVSGLQNDLGDVALL